MKPKRNKKIKIISILLIILFVGVVSAFLSRTAMKKSTPTLISTAPRRVVFDNTTPFPRQPTPIRFSLSLLKEPVFPTTLPEFTILKRNFSDVSQEVATKFSVAEKPTVLATNPMVIRYEDKNFSLLFIEQLRMVEYSRKSSPPLDGFIDQAGAEKVLATFLSEKNLLPSPLGYKVQTYYPLNTTEYVHKVASSPLQANASLLLGLYTLNNFPLVSGSIPQPAITTIIDPLGVKKLTMQIPLELERAEKEVFMNSSVLPTLINNNEGKVAMVFSSEMIKETDTTISLNSVSVSSLEAGYVWSAEASLIDPIFLAYGTDNKSKTSMYYLLPNLPQP